MEDLETSATLEFHGVRYVATLQVQRQLLQLQVETISDEPSIWTGSFPANDVGQLTRQTGNVKKFSVFVQMLLTALKRQSDTVFVDLLTAADLDLYRQRKLHPTQVQKPIEGSEGGGKRYLILTYAVEFDRVHYPLPLNPVVSPTPEVLQRTIRRLRHQLITAEKNGQDGHDSRLEEENAALKEENRCLKNTLKQYCDERNVSEAMNSTADLQRELQASIEENKELITLYQQSREDSTAEVAQLRAEIKQLRLESHQNDQTEQDNKEQERLETRRKIQDSNAAVQESLAQMLHMKAQLEETQLKNRELLRQLAIARSHAGQQATARQRPLNNPSRNGDSPSRFLAGRSPQYARQKPSPRSRQQSTDAVFPAPFKSPLSINYGASDDEDVDEDARGVRRGRPKARPAFRRFDPTAYQQEKERKLRAARARSNSRSRPPRSNGGYSSDSSMGGYSSADSRGSKTSSRSTRSRTTRDRQRELDARLSSPKKVVEPPPVDSRRPRSATNSSLPPRSRSQSRGRSPSPSPSVPRGQMGSKTTVPPPRTSTPAVQKTPQRNTVVKRRKQPPQALLDTSTDSFSDIDDRLTALQQFLREAKQGGVGVAGASTAA